MKRFGCRLVLFVVAGSVGCAAEPKPTPVPGPAASRDSRPSRDAQEELESRVRAIVVSEKDRLRACYEAGLARDPGLSGKVVLVVDVDQGGRASHIYEARREGTFTDAEIRCFASVLRAAKYHDGAASPVRIQVPLSFAPVPPVAPSP